MQTLGERLHYARKKSGFTQETLATSIGVSRGVIFNLEKNKTQPQSIVSNAICQTLNINQEWLLTGVGEMKKPDDNPLLAQLYETASHLTQAELLFLLDVIRAMQEKLEIKEKSEVTENLEAKAEPDR